MANFENIDSRLQADVNIIDPEEALDLIKAITVNTVTNTVTGSADVALDLSNVEDDIKFAIEGNETATTKLTNGATDIVPKQADYNKLIPYIIAAIQKLEAHS